jgi:hypothetical protein
MNKAILLLLLANTAIADVDRARALMVEGSIAESAPL